MLQRSVRAPNIQEAYAEQETYQDYFVGDVDSSNDPCSASNDPANSGIGDACIASGLPEGQLGIFEANLGVQTDYTYGGNPDLRPEVADTFTAGVVFDIDWLQGTQISIDYFTLEVEDTIGGFDAAVACYDLANTQNIFCDHLTRHPVTFDVIEVFEPNINRGGLKIEGIDTLIQIESDLPDSLALFGDYASLSVSFSWTHTLENSYQETSYGTTIDCVGTFGWPCMDNRDTSTFPQDRIMASTTYYSGDFDVRLTWRWMDTIENGLIRNGFIYGLSDLDLGNPYAASKSYFNLGFGYQISDAIGARLTISNLTETEPALMTDVWAGNTDPGNYDVFGRAYSLALSMRF